MQKSIIVCVALALLAVGCSSGQPAPAQATGVATYGPTSQTAPPPPRYAQPPAPQYAQPTPRYAQPAPAYASSGAFRWHTRIQDAQAQARREGKLILAGSTKPGCSLCDQFKDQVVPQAGTRVSSVAVGYMVQALAPEAPTIWQQLKANLAGSGLMPLVGVFTPDLRYLTGFGGPTDNTKLMNALATARRLYPVSARAPRHAVPQQAVPQQVGRTRRVAGTTARLNEYGEYEWTPLEELYPRPEDALTPDAVVAAAAPVLPPAAASAPTRVAPVPTTVAVAPPRPPPIAPPPPPASPVAVNRTTPRTAVPVVPARARPARKQVATPPASRAPDPALEAWGAVALRRALQQIEDGQLDEARTTLAEIGARLPDSALAREAAKGAVAVYSARRIAEAQGREQELLREQAERNLGRSMWGVLFRS